ncbi:UNVERIFIED_CONTAM: hypothetical protein K2H54_068726 [Gekko kuhli]
MFLFAHRGDTPISTYTDSYRVPCLTKESYTEPSLKSWDVEAPLSKGLTVPRVDNQVDQAHLEKMVKRAVQEYTYKNSTEPTAYRPYKYWVTREEEKYNPVFVGDDRYATWRTGPYNSATWNRYTTYLPRIPRLLTGNLWKTESHQRGVIFGSIAGSGITTSWVVLYGLW